MDVHVTTIVSAKTTTGAPSNSNLFSPRGKQATFQVKGSTSAGAGACVVKIEVSNDGVNWVVAGYVLLTLSTSEASDGFTVNVPWKYARGNVDSISGTNAAATVYMGS